MLNILSYISWVWVKFYTWSKMRAQLHFFLHVDIQCPQNHSLRRPSCKLCWKSINHKFMGKFLGFMLFSIYLYICCFEYSSFVMNSLFFFSLSGLLWILEVFWFQANFKILFLLLFFLTGLTLSLRLLRTHNPCLCPPGAGKKSMSLHHAHFLELHLWRTSRMISEELHWIYSLLWVAWTFYQYWLLQTGCGGIHL